MRKSSFSPEILCLFFIISTSILLGKVLLNVRDVVYEKVNQFLPQEVTHVEYQAFSYKEKEVIDNLEEVNVIRNIDDLNKFNEKIQEEEVNVSWLSEKLIGYQEDYFDDETLVVICLVNDDNIVLNRINGVTKKNDYITIGISKKEKSIETTDKYTWLAVIEIVDNDSKIVLDVD